MRGRRRGGFSLLLISRIFPPFSFVLSSSLSSFPNVRSVRAACVVKRSTPAFALFFLFSIPFLSHIPRSHTSLTVFSFLNPLFLPPFHFYQHVAFKSFRLRSSSLFLLCRPCSFSLCCADFLLVSAVKILPLCFCCADP